MIVKTYPLITIRLMHVNANANKNLLEKCSSQTKLQKHNNHLRSSTVSLLHIYAAVFRFPKYNMQYKINADDISPLTNSII